ncbi:DUF1465 family protein [Sneathiella sp.]|uniref:DUF1465 family protein n=1 Tax=Sneathiella sp. TaxID=1964365 RepID=UPI0039E52717
MGPGEQQTRVPQAAGTIFFSRTYDEALRLVMEAREYLLGPGRIAVRDLSSEGNFRYATESLRLTTRLTETMSWLMFQRAVLEGEISPEEAQADECHLQYQATCLPDADEEELDLLPAGLISLLERSEALYRRIDRLDKQAIASFRDS